MITVQHIVYLVARTVHHHVNDAQVGNELLAALLVADVLVANQEIKVYAHLAESFLGVVDISIDRAGKGGMTEVLANAADKFRGRTLPSGHHFRKQYDL